MGRTGTPRPRSLADDLRARSDAELVDLLRIRPDLVTPIPVDIAQLASRATTRASVVRALDRLDRFTLQVVDALAVLPEPTSPEAVRALLGTGIQDVTDALDRLHSMALVWGSRPALRLVRVAREAVGPYPAGLGPPTDQALMEYPPARLAQIAADLGLGPKGDPTAAAEAIAAAIDARLETMLDDVGGEAAAALRTLSAGPPTGRVGDARRQVDKASARTPVDQLLARGLLVPIDDHTVVLPREIGLHLRGGVRRSEERRVGKECRSR